MLDAAQKKGIYGKFYCEMIEEKDLEIPKRKLWREGSEYPEK